MVGRRKPTRPTTWALNWQERQSRRRKVITVLEPLPVYFKFAMTKDWARGWTCEKEARYAALQEHARREATAVGLHLDTEMIHGDKVGKIINYIICAFWECESILVSMGRAGQNVTERSPCAFGRLVKAEGKALQERLNVEEFINC